MTVKLIIKPVTLADIKRYAKIQTKHEKSICHDISKQWVKMYDEIHEYRYVSNNKVLVRYIKDAKQASPESFDSHTIISLKDAQSEINEFLEKTSSTVKNKSSFYIKNTVRAYLH